MGLTFQDLTVQMMFITTPGLDALCLLHLCAISCYTFSSPFQNQTELRVKPVAKNGFFQLSLLAVLASEVGCKH